MSDATMQWYQGLVEDARRRVGDLAALREDPERLYGRAELAEEGIEAVVAPGGAPVSLTLSQRALRLGPAELAARILAAQHQARDDAGRRLREAVGHATQGLDPAGLVDPARPPADLAAARRLLHEEPGR